jgi:hypothetical protein
MSNECQNYNVKDFLETIGSLTLVLSVFDLNFELGHLAFGH